MSAQKPPQDGVQEALARAAARRRETRRRWAERKLAQAQANHRSAAVTPEPKRKSKRTKGGAKSSKRARAAALDQAQVDALVPKEAQRHGDYQVSRIRLDEVVKDGKIKTVEHLGVRNLARTVVERWVSRNKIDARERDAILWFQEKHMIVNGAGPRVIASYAEKIANGDGEESERERQRFVTAREDLRTIENEVFSRRRLQDKEVWVNIVIWDVRPGEAGQRIGYCHKPGEAVALEIIRGIAHEIATLVIDGDVKRKFAKQIRDLDRIP